MGKTASGVVATTRAREFGALPEMTVAALGTSVTIASISKIIAQGRIGIHKSMSVDAITPIASADLEEPADWGSFRRRNMAEVASLA